MRSPSPMWDHSYCRVTSKQTEHDSRLRVKKQFRLPDYSEWKLAPQLFQRTCQLRGTPEIDLSRLTFRRGQIQ